MLIKSAMKKTCFSTFWLFRVSPFVFPSFRRSATISSPHEPFLKHEKSPLLLKSPPTFSCSLFKFSEKLWKLESINNKFLFSYRNHLLNRVLARTPTTAGFAD
jgi:hypothetical protein